ncbi:MAG: site-specific DNA-methyltransferase [Spirulinaceae cyanobacterium RM2_2_10]|nr:site-specific DNA-methyltransferase [Spirulinaceae cyanobacterium SM2_1_0]NJO21031.1 site-specific DNA-methyltransferase [Spirulinaceae cyanobacterium RM2_2_10]
MTPELFCGDAAEVLGAQLGDRTVDLTFLDPPFNQRKDYAYWDDSRGETDYWFAMQQVCKLIAVRTVAGGAIYFMQREKNTHWVMQTLLEAGWTFQNLIVWKKRTSAVPIRGRYGKSYQILVYATKGQRPKTFNRLRINPPLPAHYKHPRPNGIFVTDVWDDIRELTAGYFAGDEALRTAQGDRQHKQQSPIALLLRILLTSSQPGDVVLDPFAGTGTTLVVASQLGRASVGIEIDPGNVVCIQQRLAARRAVDAVNVYAADYVCTDQLMRIWGPSLPSLCLAAPAE